MGRTAVRGRHSSRVPVIDLFMMTGRADGCPALRAPMTPGFRGSAVLSKLVAA